MIAESVIVRTRSMLGRSCLLAALASLPLSAQFFTRAPMWQHEVLPVIEKNCASCHGGEQTMAELDLTKFDSVLKGGISGPPVDATRQLSKTSSTPSPARATSTS
mgnify:CR=1 FL=1